MIPIHGARRAREKSAEFQSVPAPILMTAKNNGRCRGMQCTITVVLDVNQPHVKQLSTSSEPFACDANWTVLDLGERLVEHCRLRVDESQFAASLPKFEFQFDAIGEDRCAITVVAVYEPDCQQAQKLAKTLGVGSAAVRTRVAVLRAHVSRSRLAS